MRKKQVWIEGKKVAVNALVHCLSGYSVHADQNDLIRFVLGCGSEIKQLHLIHGDSDAKQEIVRQLTGRAYRPRLCTDTCSPQHLLFNLLKMFKD